MNGEPPIFLKNNMGKIIGRQIILTIYSDGKLKIKGPSDKNFLVHVLQKAIESLREVKPDTSYNGIEVVSDKGINAG